MNNQYPNLEKWTMPRNYYGAEWPEYYSAGVGRSRDSDALERANFDAMVAALAKCPEMETPDGEEITCQVVRENHWVCGWVEWIAIHETDHARLAVADKIRGKMENYAVIDEELWSRYEDEECEQVWRECMDDAERVKYLRKHLCKRDGRVRVEYPVTGETPYQTLRAAVKGSWYHAANLLPCPSDLIA